MQLHQMVYISNHYYYITTIYNCSLLFHISSYNIIVNLYILNKTLLWFNLLTLVNAFDVINYLHHLLI